MSIHAIPTELLGAIFVDCIPTSGRINELVPRMNTAPLALVSVCQRWRNVAISTPKLWTYIVLDSFQNMVEQHIRALTLYLERSAKHPLTLVYVDDTGYFTPRQGNKDAQKQFEVVLSSFVKRCKSLVVRTGDMTILQRIITASEDSVHLQLFQLEAPYAHESSSSLILPHKVVSRLGSLRAKNRHTRFVYLTTPRMQCSSLRRLELFDPLRWSVLIQWVEHCPNLEDVLVSVHLDVFPAGRALQTLILPNLRRFSFNIKSVSASAEAWLNETRDGNIFQLPSLTVLALGTNLSERLFVRLFGTSHDVKSLYIGEYTRISMDSDVAAFVTYLQQFRALEDLTVRAFEVDWMKFISKLIVADGGEEALCPNLKKLILEKSLPWDEQSLAATVRMVTSRCPVDTNSSFGLDPETRFGLQELILLKDKGLAQHPIAWHPFLTHPETKRCRERGLEMRVVRLTKGYFFDDYGQLIM